MTAPNKPTALDLFCGCGGISAGLRDAGFQVLAGADIEPKFMDTFQRNFGGARAFAIDLAQSKPAALMSNVGVAPGELDILAGGPPCQGFSKNVPRKLRRPDDANNLLVKTFLDYAEALAPKMILMENVAEMRNGFSQRFSEEVRERLTQCGYSVASAVMNAAEYGVPQRRRRAFFLATKDAPAPAVPPPTHRKRAAQSKSQSDFLGARDFVTVWDAIGDLPSVAHGEGEEPCEYAREPFSDYQASARNSDGKVNNHIARRLAQTQYARLSALLPGQGHGDLPDELKVRGGYSGAYGRLTKDMVAPTITRWMFHPGSGRWGHPTDIRTLTIREAARIQGFKDDYEFVGSFVQQAGQLGNAAPPLLISAIASSMRAQTGV